VYFSPGIGRFLESPPGVPDVNVLNMARYGLGVHLRAVLEETLRAGKNATRENIHVKDNGASLTLTLRARPIKRQCGTTDFIAVVFEPAQDGTEPLPPLRSACRPSRKSRWCSH
jgi:two-component system, chemotaxis family, CheB/CheR fusion protein